MSAKNKQILTFVALVVLLGAVQLRGFFMEVLHPLGTDEGPSTVAVDANQTPIVQPMQAGVLWARPEPTPTDLRNPMSLEKTPPASPPKPPQVKGPATTVVTPVDPNTEQTINIMTTQTDARGAEVHLDDSTPVFFLKGIIFNKTGRSAIITDTGILHVDDEIHKARVIKISPRVVEFRKNKQTYIVRVGQQPSDAK